jgi:hypothetical protein
MGALPRIGEAEPLGRYVLRLTFTDGLVRELDFAPMLTEGVLAALNDEALFAQVAIDPIAGTVCWPGGVDLDPDVLHGDHEPARSPGPTVIAEYRLRPTA